MLDNISTIWDSTNPEIRTFSDKVRFSAEFRKLLETGISFITVVEGTCLTRPEIRPVGDCSVFIRQLDPVSGSNKTYKLVYKEVKYEALCFD